MEVQGGDVARMTFEQTLLADGLTVARLRDLVDLHYVMCCYPQVLLVGSDRQLVDVNGRRINIDLHRGDAGVHIPELHGVVVAGRHQEDLVFGLSSLFLLLLLRGLTLRTETTAP